MRISYIVFFISLTAWAQPTPQIEVLPNPKSIEDFDHQYKGCLENSECDQVMGLQLNRWKELIKKIQGEEMTDTKKNQFLELFRSKYGIPVEFYTTEKSQQGFKPLMFNSHCKEHNPKPPGQKTLKGMAFVKSLKPNAAVVWRDQTQIEVPIGELFTPQPVTVYLNDGPQTFLLPIDDQPLFMKDGQLYVLKEEDGLFYTLKISKTGDWKIENLELSNLSHWSEHRSEVACPKEEKKLAPKEFGVEFCKTIWNEDTKKTVVIRLHQGCA